MTSSPIFRSPDSPPDAPYEPAEVDDETLDEIKAAMIERGIPTTPENLAHALETEEIRDLLDDYGINPERKVTATRDRAGVVRLNYAEFRRALREAARLAGR